MRQLTRSITSWMSDRANNAIAPGSSLPAFDTPLAGCASGADPMFDFLKEDIGGDFYWTPLEAFRAAFPESVPEPEELSVISWVLPQTEHTRKAHRSAEATPSIEWSRARHYGEMVNNNLRKRVVEYFMQQGVDACAPVLNTAWSREISRRYGFASRWSERHTAHACGLGTFGLSDGFISRAGKAIRLGSIIVRKQYEPTERTYSMHNEWCLFFATGKCQACIRRCPAGAISERGHDKAKCKDYIRNFTAIHVEKNQLGFRVNSCGLCQTKVPCEHKNPTDALKKRPGSRAEERHAPQNGS